MLITIISQCEKNALAKTRSVLDAFAERIGSSTWQAIITEDGLEVLHKELRKTATKSTAISCHWHRSRTRNQLLWIVGRKSAFNAQGNVPVNETENEVGKFMERNSENMIYANTAGQKLSEHLYAVAYVASELINQLIPDNEVNNDPKLSLMEAVYIAGLFHDIGKIDPQFQQWIYDKKIKKKIEDIDENGVHHNTRQKINYRFLADQILPIQKMNVLSHLIYVDYIIFSKSNLVHI